MIFLISDNILQHHFIRLVGWAVSRKKYKLMTRLRRNLYLGWFGCYYIYFSLLYQISTNQIKCLQFHGKTVKLILDEKQINTKKRLRKKKYFWYQSHDFIESKNRIKINEFLFSLFLFGKKILSNIFSIRIKAKKNFVKKKVYNTYIL